MRAFLSISLGQLRLAAGPLAAIAHLPFLGGALQLPATAAAAIPTLTSGVAAVPIAAALMASTFGVTTPPSASGDTKTQNAAAVAGVDTRRAAGIDSTIPTGTGSADNGATSDGTTSSGGSSSGASGDGTTATLTDADRAAGSTTTTTVGATGDPTATTAPTTTDAKRTTDRVLETPTTMTTTSSPPTATTMPAPVTTMPVATTTTPIVNTLTLMVSQSSSHSSPQALAGSSFTIGSSAYIYAVTTHTDVSFTYPGGSSSRTSPFDMMMSGSNVTRFMMPLLPGTYSVSAHATGQGSSNDTSASFTVSLF